MVVGLGTGSTAEFAIRALGKRCASENIAIKCIPTSEASRHLGTEVGLTITSLEEEPVINLTIDGAAENTRSVTVPLTVNPTTMPDFALAVDNTSLDVAAGASDTLNVAVQWTGGFSDDVALVCNAAPEIQCTFTPATVPSTTSTASLTVAVDAAATLEAITALMKRRRESSGFTAVFLPLVECGIELLKFI